MTGTNITNSSSSSSSLVAEVIPQCEDDLLLYFPYEKHFNDVTCHQAIATQYGTGVSIQFDAERNGNVACFTGETHFEVTVTCSVSHRLRIKFVPDNTGNMTFYANNKYR